MSPKALPQALLIAILLTIFALPAAALTPTQNEVVALAKRAEKAQREGKLDEAASLLARALSASRKVFGERTGTTADLTDRLADVLRLQGQFKPAEPLFKQSIGIRKELVEKSTGKDRAKEMPFLVRAQNNLALLYHQTGRHAEAELLFRSCLELREVMHGKRHFDVASTLNNLGDVHRAGGLYRLAERDYKNALAIYKDLAGGEKADQVRLAQATTENNLGVLYTSMAQYGQAERLLSSSLAVRRERLGKSHPNVAQTLNNLALLYHHTTQHARAERAYLSCLEIQESRLGSDHPDVSTTLNNLGHLCQELKRYDDAERYYLRCLNIREAKLKGTPQLAGTLNNLGWLYYRRGNLAVAERYLKRSVAAWDAGSKPDHPEAVAAHKNLGLVLESKADYRGAEREYRRSVEIAASKLDRNHPQLMIPLNNLARVQEHKGDVAGAAQVRDRARHIARNYAGTVLPLLLPEEQFAFLHRERPELDRALSLALARPDDAALTLRAAGWLLNGKGQAQESLARSAVLQRERGNNRLVDQLLQVRSQLAGLSTTKVPGRESERARAQKDLAEQERELARRVRQAGILDAAPPWVEPDAVQRALPPGSVLIDVVRMQVTPTAGQRKGARYVAWVTPARGPVRLVDLGPADAMDSAVEQVRQHLQGAAKRLGDKGEVEAERELRQPLEALSKRLLGPLLPHVGKAEHWLISPDGSLWLVPWQALLLKADCYAVEDHQISYVSSGRDLLPGPAPKVQPGLPLVVGNPDYDLDASDVQSAAVAVLGKKAAASVVTRSLSGALRLGRAPRLPGTAFEAKAIASSLKAGPQGRARLLTDRNAIKAVVQAAHNPRVLVLCTHAFFLEEKRGAKAEHPLLRCGLLFAGCNDRRAGAQGVLTGLEVLGMDLRGCELVVLSACDTGLGTVQTGEGVAGLRQAFQLAGASAVVTTLWKVPDEASAQLMNLFFRNQAKGMSKAAALQSAQREILQKRRADSNVTTHPFYWAAYTLTGR
jgi:CHAT domain-containing protein/tetratricopeptide (TPR) repeat protein